MNSLFSDFFTKFGGVFLEVFETISGRIWKEFRRFSDEFPRNFPGMSSDVFDKCPGNFLEILLTGWFINNFRVFGGSLREVFWKVLT